MTAPRRERPEPLDPPWGLACSRQRERRRYRPDALIAAASAALEIAVGRQSLSHAVARRAVVRDVVARRLVAETSESSGSVGAAHFKCEEITLLSSNMVILSLPNKGRSVSSAMISRPSFGSCRLFFLM